VADGYLEEYLPYLMTSARQPGEDYTYGQYLEPQIEEVIRMYKEDGHATNQAYMTVGDRESIYLADPPCLRGIDTRIKDGKLHFVVYFRSWDLWNGFPANMGAIQLLKEYMSSSIGVEDGQIIASSKGLHLYDYVWELAKLRTMCENPSALIKGECTEEG
jgi:thymidylate synthase